MPGHFQEMLKERQMDRGSARKAGREKKTCREKEKKDVFVV